MVVPHISTQNGKPNGKFCALIVCVTKTWENGWTASLYINIVKVNLGRWDYLAIKIELLRKYKPAF